MVVEEAGEGPGAVRSGSVRPAAASKWWPGRPAPYAYPLGGPPCPE